MESNAKFWISVCSAFVVPTLIYAYGQGRTQESIQMLNDKMVDMQQKVDNIDQRVYVVKGTVDGNAIILEWVDGQVDGMNKDIEEHKSKIAVLDYKFETIRGLINGNKDG